MHERFSEIKQLKIDGKFGDKLRAVIILNNASDKKEEGIVLRYALRLQIVRKDGQDSKPIWEVPYYADELRVPVIKAGITKDAKIISLKLGEQLKRLSGTGFEPVALKLEIMLSPRSGGNEDGRIAESVLPLEMLFRTAPASGK